MSMDDARVGAQTNYQMNYLFTSFVRLGFVFILRQMIVRWMISLDWPIMQSNKLLQWKCLKTTVIMSINFLKWMNLFGRKLMTCHHMTHPIFFVPNDVLYLISNGFGVSVRTSELVLKTFYGH